MSSRVIHCKARTCSQETDDLGPQPQRHIPKTHRRRLQTPVGFAPALLEFGAETLTTCPL